MNLIESLLAQIKRNYGLIEVYRSIGPVGNFALTAITNDVNIAEKAISEQDTVQMIRSYETLKNNE